jgi:hypothetical protein
MPRPLTYTPRDGVKPTAIAPYGMKELFFHDPDGSDLCFQWKANGLL